MHFGRDAMAATDADLEDLMAQLSPEELTKLVDEMASDPDDKHLPASVRNSYRCDKAPTGELNRDSLINHINQEGLNAPEKVIVVVIIAINSISIILIKNVIEFINETGYSFSRKTWLSLSQVKYVVRFLFQHIMRQN